MLALAFSFFAAWTARAQACAPLACSEIRVDPPSSGTGYIPTNLQVDQAAGVLNVTTTAGLAFKAGNSQDNALGVGVDAPSQVTRIETTLDSMPAASNNNEQAGLWFGMNLW